MNTEHLPITTKPKPWHETWQCQQCNKCCRYPTTVIFYRHEKEKFDRDFPDIKPRYKYHSQFDFFELDLRPGEYCPYFIDQKCLQHARFGFDYKSKTCKKFPFYDSPDNKMGEKTPSTYCASIMNSVAKAQYPKITRNYTVLEQYLAQIWLSQDLVYKNALPSSNSLQSILLKLSALLALTQLENLQNAKKVDEKVLNQIIQWVHEKKTESRISKKPLVLRALLAVLFRIDFNVGFRENLTLILKLIFNSGTLKFRYEKVTISCRAEQALSDKSFAEPERIAATLQEFVNQKLNYFQLQNRTQLLWLVLIIKGSLWRVANGDKSTETFQYVLGLYDQAYLFRFQEYMQARSSKIFDQLLESDSAFQALVDFT